MWLFFELEYKIFTQKQKSLCLQGLFLYQQMLIIMVGVAL